MNVEHILLEDITISGTNPRKHIEECDCENPEVSIIKMGEETKCPECMEETSQEELDMFGGLCEECSGAFDD